ncbi:HTH-type transcriptional regulator KipR [bioreactor metagenome]|uniref:HTH-type transcriptional regulator KipR n=1 Tax=bioreactor metagenome TaxID=1076179 RepID=A0A645H1X0_9ZZZZ
MGRRAPLYAGACPRAIFSFLPDEEIDKILSKVELIKYTKNTVIDKDEIWKTIKETRKLGYTISYSELAEETYAIGAPIMDYTGNVAGSLSIVGPENRLNDDTIDLYVSEVLKATRGISRALGYRG